jgi:hypothetical protein
MFALTIVTMLQVCLFMRRALTTLPSLALVIMDFLAIIQFMQIQQIKQVKQIKVKKYS